MFVSGFNLILGHKSFGRSKFLFSVAKIFQDLNYKTLFYGATDEYNCSSFKYNSPFDLMLFYRFGDKRCRLTENILQMCSNGKFDYVFIDDIDYMSLSDIKILSNISTVPLICTCDVSKIPEKINNFKHFEIIKGDTLFFCYENQKIQLNDFYNIISRDEKINSIVNDKG